jgi:hypothetical protein
MSTSPREARTDGGQVERDPRVLAELEFEWWGGDTRAIVAARARRAQEIARERASAPRTPKARPARTTRTRNPR